MCIAKAIVGHAMEKKVVTIVLDKELQKRLRELQAKMIKDTKENISFSQVVNDVLIKGLKQKKYK